MHKPSISAQGGGNLRREQKISGQSIEKPAKIRYNKRRISAGLVFLMLLFGGCTVINTSMEPSSTRAPDFILDAGHGGFDGGASSADGLLEKDINLQITLQLRELLERSGYIVLLTRDRDIATSDPSAGTLREKKRTDIANRFQLMRQFPDAVFLSIHQNHFTQSKYSGAQFFYAPNDDASRALAGCLRDAVRARLQPENTREIKPCGDSVYLIYHAPGTAVLAECGFLSNPQEAARLSDPAYQRAVAFTLYEGLLRNRAAE